MFDNQSCIAAVKAKKRRYKAMKRRWKAKKRRWNLTHRLQKLAPSNMY
jgi:hypothetical protein